MASRENHSSASGACEVGRLAKERPALEKIGSRIQLEQQLQTERLSEGRLQVESEDVIPTLETLTKCYTNFDGVSDRDLHFWLPQSNDALANNYSRLISDFATSGKMPNRILLIWRSDLDSPTILGDVLIRHLKAGIGVAVVIYDELPSQLQRLATEGKLHFGLWVTVKSKLSPCFSHLGEVQKGNCSYHLQE